MSGQLKSPTRSMCFPVDVYVTWHSDSSRLCMSQIKVISISSVALVDPEVENGLLCRQESLLDLLDDCGLPVLACRGLKHYDAIDSKGESMSESGVKIFVV